MTNSPFPLALNDRGEEVAALQDTLNNLGYTIPEYEQEEQVFGVGTQAALLKFQTKYNLRRTGAFDDRTKPVLSRAFTVLETNQNHVEGRILLENGRLAEGLTLRLYSQSFGGKSTMLDETKTDKRGFYHFAYPPQEKTANLEVRVVDAEDEDKEISLSKIKLNAERYEILNLVAPASFQKLDAEYRRLTADLSQQLDGLNRLADARETGDRYDLTLLHQVTGWDARLIALVATAFKRSPETNISPDILYALFRLGLPSDKQILARVSPSTVAIALKKAREAGIIRLEANQLAEVMGAFETFARNTRLQTKAPGALSTVGEMLVISGLNDEERAKFADLYFAPRRTVAELWQKTYEILDGTEEDKTKKLDRLRLQSRLAYLTFHNAKLTEWLQTQIGSLDNLTWLVEQGFYKSETWESHLWEIANNNEEVLKTFIPPAYRGEKVEDLCALYAADMARKVRLSYPTPVVGQLIQTDELRLSTQEQEHTNLKTPVYNLLKRATQEGFELGRQSLTAFRNQHPELFKEEEVDRLTLQTFKRLQRLYQITPSDKALVALFELDFTSANEIAALPLDRFLARAKQAALSDDEATLVYRKAQQVSAVTLNLVTMAQLMDSAPPIYGIFPAPQSPSWKRREDGKKNLIKHYPSLETLFGSVDFCECEHCRSVLSPAAYFVALLKFLEEPNDESDPTPYDILVGRDTDLPGRRPDLPHLELSCENTNTALPYIDIVNEILEYWVANDKTLHKDAVHDTGDATTPELLAEPQNIRPEAYNILRAPTTCYPLTLPFDLWLETVRQFLKHFKIPLWQVLEMFRPTDALFDESVGYDRAAIFAEYLDISPAEYNIIAHLKALDETLKLDKKSRKKLFTLWTNLPTTGKNPLYAQLFLTQSVLKTDSVFHEPFSNYLCYFNETSGQYEPFYWDETQMESIETGNVALKNHLPAIQGALNLTNNEIEQILTDADQTLDTAALSLTNVSLLYRYGLLAKALKLSVPELIALKELSGLNPFHPLHSAPLTTLDQDYPFTQTLAFVEVVETVKASDFSVEELNYLLRHQFDPVGQYRPDSNGFLALVKNLAAGLRQIHAEHAVPEDADNFTDDILQQKLNLVLPADIAATFFGMWTGSIEYEASCTPRTPLDPETFTDEPAIREVRYDGVSTQRLTFRGVLTDAEKTRLNALYPSTELTVLLDAVQNRAQTFFETYLQKEDPPTTPNFGFLHSDDFEVLFASPQTIPDDAAERQKQALRDQNAEQLRRKRDILTNSFLPYLQTVLSRQLIVQTLAPALKAEVPLTEALLTNANLLADPSDATVSLLPAFIELQEQGVSAEFFDATGNSLQSVNISEVDTEAIDPKPAGTTSARLEGYLEVPTTGAYRFYGVCSQTDTVVEFRFDHLPDPVFRGIPSSEGAVVEELKAKVPYHFTLNVYNLEEDNDVKLMILGETLPKGSLSRLTLYPQAAVERTHRAYTLLTKVLQLIQGFGFSEREVGYLLTHPDDFDGLNLSQLPTRNSQQELAAIAKFYQVADPSLTDEDALLRARTEHATLAREVDNASTLATELFTQFLRLANYAQLKATLAGNTDDLIAIFEHARRKFSVSEYTAVKARAELFDNLCHRFAELTRRDLETVRATAVQLGFTTSSRTTGDEYKVEAPNFTQEKDLQKLWEALQVIQKIGVPVSALARWATPAPNFTIARDLRNTVKARYEPENWQRVAQPIFDKLRQRQRDALVAYVLANHPEGFKNPNQLFEYFLIDPGMEPVVQTSRIRLAISSVQLFIQRCLLNLEPKVRPSAINSQHWEWMKRYRVWEANCKIFLYPENWLEPEFRDDKTHLFLELESALLQGDVSNDLVEDAFFQYLKKLEEIANLVMVTMYCEERSDDSEENILHVIGRTANEPHLYFYRRYANHMWTPWEPVTTEIAGDHVVAVMWRGRLHLFWVTFLEKTEENSDGGNGDYEGLNFGDVKLEEVNTQAAALSQKFVEVSLTWCEYFQGQWTTPESNGFGNPISVPVEGNFNPREVFIFVTKKDQEGTDSVTIHLSGETFNSYGYSYKIHEYEDGLGSIPYGYYLGGYFEEENRTAFSLVSKNSPPAQVGRESPQEPPYYEVSAEATRYKGSGVLQVTFVKQTTTDKETPSPILELEEHRSYSLLTYSNPSEVNANKVEALKNRFFYQDDQHTFFVEPTLSLVPFSGDIDPTPGPERDVPPEYFEELLEHLEQQSPGIVQGFPLLPESFSSLARYSIRPQRDWATHPRLLVEFDGHFIGQEGRLESTELTGTAQVGAMTSRVSVGGGGLQPFLLEKLNTQHQLNSTRPLAGNELIHR